MLTHLTKESWIRYQKLDPSFHLSQQEFEELWNQRPTDESYVRMYGKKIAIPRRQQAYGQSYAFSGTENKAIPVTPLIQRYMDLANQMEESQDPFKNGGAVFNMAFLNWYQDGKEYIGYHSDDEKMIIQGSSIYCFSFGAERDFLLKDKSSGEVKSVVLEDNSLIVMGGDCQKTHKHSIPKRSKVRGPRVSITLRKFRG